MSICCTFQSMKIWNLWKKPWSNKNSKSIHLWSNQFRKPNANVSVKVHQEKTSNQNLKHTKKTYSTRGSNYAHQNEEVEEKLQPVSFVYVWTKFEHQVKDKDASEKKSFLSRLRRPEPHLRHALVEQWAGAKRCSNNIFQSTTIVVNGVEHQRTFNIKITEETDYVVFRSNISFFIKSLGKQSTGRYPDIGKKFNFIAKAHKPRFENPMAKSTGTFKEQTKKTPQNNCRKDSRSSKNKKNTILANFSPWRYEIVETRHIPSKNSIKSIHSWSNQSWNLIGNVSVKAQHKIFSTYKLTRQWKNLSS